MSVPLAKKIGRSDIIGEQGIALIRQTVLSMNFMFYETGSVEAGIDGFIELRDETTGEVSNRLIQVQGKATERPFAGETEHSLEYVCSDADIEYWRGGTAPVLLIVTRPSQQLAYWKSIKEWFSDTERLRSRKVVFDKSKDLFTKDAKAAIVDVAMTAGRGAISPTVRKKEIITPNLLRAVFSPKVYWAPTKFKDNKSFGVALRARHPQAPGEWVVKSGGVLSFHDLSEPLWTEFCDAGAAEPFDTSEWSDSSDEDRLRDFVQLLNRALNSLVEPSVRYDKDEGHYYFIKQNDRGDLKYSYPSLQQNAKRRVVGRYGKRKDPKETSYFRHSAFWGHFVRYDGIWYLEVNPTYRFTRNGYKPSRFRGELLKKIKELENNAAVLGQFIMWRHFLITRGKRDLYRGDYRFLSLEVFPDFELDIGVPDNLWAAQEFDPSSPLFDYRQVQPE